VQVLALHSGHSLEELQVRGQHLLRKHMVRQDVGKLCLVLWLQQRVEGAGWQSSEAFVGGSEHCERTRRRQSLGQICCNHCSHQGGEIIDRLCKLHDVWLVRSKTSRRKHHSINDVGNAIAGQIVCTNNLAQVLEVRAHLHTGSVLEHVQVLALHSGHSLEELQVRGQHLLRKHMVRQDVGKLCLVLWLQQRVEGAGWQSSEAFVGGSEHCERTRRRQSLGQICCHHCSHQGGEIIDRLCKLHNVDFWCLCNAATPITLHGFDVKLHVAKRAFGPDRQALQFLLPVVGNANTRVLGTSLDCITCGIVPAACELVEWDLHSSKLA